MSNEQAKERLPIQKLLIIPLVVLLLVVFPGKVSAPAQTSVPKDIVIPEEVHVPQSKAVSRGGSPTIEHRVMRITAYTARDKGMNGLGITASGEKAIEGVTVAAPPDIPFGAQIYIPALDKTYVVTDRGGAIRGNRLDLFIEDRKRALEFGVKDLEVLIKK